jgi:serine protease Do
MSLSSDQQGVLVQQVERGSPADEAGLRGSYKPVVVNGRQLLVGGDVMIAMDGLAVNGVVQQAQPGQEVTLTPLRDGKQVEVPVTLGERPAPTPTP